MIQFKENAQTDRRMDGDGKMDGQTLFYRTLPATAGGPISTFHQSVLTEDVIWHCFSLKCQISKCITFTISRDQSV